MPFRSTASRPRRSSPSTTAARTFSKFYRIEDGLGPLFNEVACVACHGVEAGRSGNRRNTHFGLRDNDVFDPLAEHGGALIQLRGIGPITTGDGTSRFRRRGAAAGRPT